MSVCVRACVRANVRACMRARVCCQSYVNRPWSCPYTTWYTGLSRSRPSSHSGRLCFELIQVQLCSMEICIEDSRLMQFADDCMVLKNTSHSALPSMAQWKVPHAVVKTRWLHALTCTFVVVPSRVSVEVLLAWRCRLSSLYKQPGVWIWWQAGQPRDGDNPKHDQTARWEVQVWQFPSVSTGPS